MGEPNPLRRPYSPIVEPVSECLSPLSGIVPG